MVAQETITFFLDVSIMEVAVPEMEWKKEIKEQVLFQ